MNDLFLETLEPRIAPAALINPKTVQYTDVDGDIVQVAITKGVFIDTNSSPTVTNILQMSFEDLAGGKQILKELNLTDLQFAGTGLKITVTKGAGGDGLVDIGSIFATGNDLGAVSVQGDVVKISAGNQITPQSGVASLQVNSLGVLDPTDFGLTDRLSSIVGKLGSFKNTGDFSGTLNVTGGIKSGIGLIDIGGSVIAGADDTNDAFFDGAITSTGAIGAVTIGGNLDGSAADDAREAYIFSSTSVGNVTIKGSTGIISGTHDFTGRVEATNNMGNIFVVGSIDGTHGGNGAGWIGTIHGKLGTVSVNGDLLGGAGEASGVIHSDMAIGKTLIGGSIVGSSGASSGRIDAFGGIASLFVGGSITGSTGVASGSVHGSLFIGTVTVGGAITGNTADGSGLISSDGNIGAVAVVGNIQGGAGDNSGAILAGEDIAKVTVSNGGLIGAAGDNSGSVQAINGLMGMVVIKDGLDGGDGLRSGSLIGKQSITSVTLNGSIVGGNGDFSGLVTSAGKIGNVSLVGNIEGGDGTFSGGVTGGGGLGNVTLAGTGNLMGGTGDDSGTIQGGYLDSVTNVINPGNIGKVVMAGSVTGNSALRSGTILAWGGNMTEASIAGSITGGAGLYSALVYATNNFGKATVGGDLEGGTGEISGRIATDRGNLGPVFIAGDVIGNTGRSSATIYAGNGLSTVTIGGLLKGGAGDASGAIGVTKDLSNNYTYSAKIDTVTVGNGVDGGDLVGGGGDRSGSIVVQSALKSAIINGEIKGGAGDYSGAVYVLNGALTAISVTEGVTGDAGLQSGVIWGNSSIGTVSIGGDLKGGSADQSGMIITFGKANTIDIVGSVIGTDYSNTGYVFGQAGFGKITIGGNLEGGNNSNDDTFYTGAVVAGAIGNGGSIIWGAIGSIEVKGNIISGEVTDAGNDLQNSGAIRATANIAKLIVGGSIDGNETMPVWITGFVNPTATFANNVAVGSVSVAVNVDHALILAGVIDATSTSMYAGSSFSRIGSITVGGDWTASSAAAGVDPGPNGYGVGDIVVTGAQNIFSPPPGVKSNIGPVVIGGQVTGGQAGDQYGFVAQGFTSITINGVAQVIPPATGGTTNITTDVNIHRMA